MAASLSSLFSKSVEDQATQINMINPAQIKPRRKASGRNQSSSDWLERQWARIRVLRRKGIDSEASSRLAVSRAALNKRFSLECFTVTVLPNGPDIFAVFVAREKRVL